MTEEPRFARLRLVLIALLLAWLGPAAAWVMSRSIPVAFFTGSFTCAFLGTLFLLLCLPLGRLVSQVQQTKLPVLPRVMDLIMGHSLSPFSWPRSRRGWTLACLLLAGYFWIVAV